MKYYQTMCKIPLGIAMVLGMIAWALISQVLLFLWYSWAPILLSLGAAYGAFALFEVEPVSYSRSLGFDLMPLYLGLLVGIAWGVMTISMMEENWWYDKRQKILNLPERLWEKFSDG